MDLPFAVDSPSDSLKHSASSLVTASSQGSFLPATSAEGSAVFAQNLAQYTNEAPTVVTGEVPYSTEAETIDFTYVNVSEDQIDDEVEIVIDGGLPPEERDIQHGEVLALLLSGNAQQNGGEVIVNKCEEANEAAHVALESKKKGDFSAALNSHTQAAKIFRDAAVSVRDQDVSLSNSLLLLSQAQARSAVALKRSLKQHPTSTKNGGNTSSPLSQKERIRAAVRGALVTKKEEDISNSMFLGKATSGPEQEQNDPVVSNDSTPPTDVQPDSSANPVDEMMELERELRDMDMELKLGNSIASLGARTHSRFKEDGSFMVVPPGPAAGSSYMSSSLWAAGTGASNPVPSAPAGNARARANRVQNILEASSAAGQVIATAPNAKSPTGLESSWWGNQSTASHTLASSVISISSNSGRSHGNDSDHPASNKQVMRLMDALKALGDENANLLREAEGAEEARMEAKATKEQMLRFKEEYRKRFASLKSALEKFRKGYPEHLGGEPNPVTSSEFSRFASTSEQLQRQEHLIRKLTADLKREKEESKKKDAALRKYESFYREVKQRSAQKAAQRQKEQQAGKQRQKGSTSSRSNR